MPEELKMLYGNADPEALQAEDEAPAGCLTCPRFLKGCLGEDALRLPLKFLIKRCQLLRVHLNLSYDKLAEKAGLSKIGVMRVLRGEVKDPSFHTIQSIAKVLMEDSDDSQPCPSQYSAEDLGAAAAAIEEAARLRSELTTIEARHAEERAADRRAIDYLKHQVERLESQAETSASQAAVRDRRKAIALTVMGILLFLAMAAIITALVIDRLNPDKGFFWLDPSAFYDFTRGASSTMPPLGLL